MPLPLLPTSSPETWTKDQIGDLINNATSLLLYVIGGIAIIYLIIGAYGYFTAFGNEERANKAKTTITWAIVGIVVVILARVIVAEVWRLLTNKPITF